MTFSELSKQFQKLEHTASRNAMTEMLASLFGKTGISEIGQICYLLQGRVAPMYEAPEFGVAEKLIIRAVAHAAGVGEQAVLGAFQRTGDLGNAAEQTLHDHGKRGVPGGHHESVAVVFNTLERIATASGVGSQEKKITLLSGILRSVDPLAARYIVRILLDKLRLGFSDMTILDSLSVLLVRDKSLRGRLEDAYNVHPDIGFIARTVKEHGIRGLTNVRARVGAPILAALCQRLPTADEMVVKMGTVAVEPKFDGVRVQIHVQKVQSASRRTKVNVQSYSRNLENTTAMFPELMEIGKQLDATEAILDSEAIGIDPKTGAFIPFQETMTRKRKHDIVRARASVPLKFYVFDILLRNGKDLLTLPLSSRRSVLEQTVQKGNILVISPQKVTADSAVIRSYHDEQLKKGLEGVVVKKWVSPYEPGRRGYSWVKFKEEEGKTGKLTDTVDAVVLGYYRGEGKRTGFGIGALLVGVKHGESFVTITKIGTGISDELWKELKKELGKLRVSVKPKEYGTIGKSLIPDTWVAAKLVVEVAGDDLTQSPTHGAGYAMRFPRLVRIRRDKSPAQATTITEIRRMYSTQTGIHNRR